MSQLILASTSAYRQQLLQRLCLPFDVVSPQVDETPLTDEAPSQMAIRLAHAKAAAVAITHPHACVIGSDQVAILNDKALGKPGTRAAAIAQLSALSSHLVTFHTALCIIQGSRVIKSMDATAVRFRRLQQDEIIRYVDAEQPLDCAGSFKSEGLGIALIDSIATQDPAALIGLPLISLARGLRQCGFQVP